MFNIIITHVIVTNEVLIKPTNLFNVYGRPACFDSQFLAKLNHLKHTMRFPTSTRFLIPVLH